MLKRAPAAGIVGLAALREASTTEYGQILNLVRAALAARYKDDPANSPGGYVYVEIEALYADRVIVARGGRYWQLAYTLDDKNQVVLQEPVEVLERFDPVALREAAQWMREAKDAAGGELAGAISWLEKAIARHERHMNGKEATSEASQQKMMREMKKALAMLSGEKGTGDKMREAIDAGDWLIEASEDGKVWDVIVLRAGLSKNGVWYTDHALRESVKAFEGAKVFVKSNDEHIKGGRPDINKLAGWLSDARFVEGKATDTGRLEARLNLTGAASLRETIAQAWQRGKKDLVGLSIDAVGKTTKPLAQKLREGVKRIAESILKVNSVDLILDPAAGGALVRMVEAANPEEQSAMLKETMLAKIKAKFPNLDAATLSDEQILERYAEAVAADKPAPTDRAGEPMTREEFRTYQRLVEARAAARTKILATTLPQPSKDQLLIRFDRLERFTEADVDAEIKAERDHVVRLAEAFGLDAGKVKLDGDIQVEDRPAKIAGMLDAFFDRTHKDHRATQSFKECYIEMTGDTRVTGRLEHCDRRRLAESVGALRESLDTSAWTDVVGSSLRRTLIRDYQRPNQYDVWRRIANVVPVSDFRTNERTRFGGYGDLPAVAEGSPYLALTSPTDEKATYAVSKKGGTEDITLEMIRNDDVAAIRQIPGKLSGSAKRTLAKFVLDFIRTNPTIYDSVAFFHNTHANLGANALDATYLAAARLRMLKQAEADSADRLGIGPKSLIVPVDLEQTAVDLFSRNTNNDKSFVNNLSLEVLPVWYWTDTNDWAIGADPMELPGIEVGFLDGNEEPELFVQDNPTVGSLFTNDKVTWKIRHIFGGNVVNYRAFDKSVVT